MAEPSTAWRERIDPSEAERFARQGEKLAAVGVAKSALFGKGRILHRKPVLALGGSFTVHDGLPAHARFGVFAAPRAFPALVRLSNGSFAVQDNAAPDIRGFAVKLTGVEGEAALGGQAESQDFLFINHETFGAPSSDEFVDVVSVAARGKLALVLHLLRRHGIGGGLTRLKRLAATQAKPFAGFNAESFNTVLPICIGPYAGRLRLEPVRPQAGPGKDVADDLRAQLAAGPLAYDVGIQFYSDEASTPIEDATRNWTTPFLPVASLTLTETVPDVEQMRFDPWGGLAAHRPLGEIMRARKAAYYVSQQGRGLA